MNKKEIDSIVYLIKEAKRKGAPKPIVFMGAGMSVSAGIPIAQDIVKAILIQHKDKPEILALKAEEKTYATIMNSLNANERNEVLRNYINQSKINAAHIYLTQLLQEGYIDYILTVNFDNVLLRASALFNYIPPVYDIANLDSLTTTTIPIGSVTYLHGQHTGLYLLNTTDEMYKIENHISPFLNKICNGRPWIIIGYSGEDAIFDQIVRLKQFDNELFWIGYKNELPNSKVQNNLLNIKSSGCSFISGYDADNFFMTLHSKLEIQTPMIFQKPFTFLHNLINDVIDEEISDNITSTHNSETSQQDERTLTSYLSNNLSQVKKHIYDSILKYESPFKLDEINDIDISKIIQKITEISIKKDFEKEMGFINMIKHIPELSEHLSSLYLDWGNHISEIIEISNQTEMLDDCIKKYKIAESYNPDIKSIIYNNWGAALLKSYIITLKEDTYLECIEKFNASHLLDTKYSTPIYNWANAIASKAKILNHASLFREAIGKYEEAFNLEPNNDFIVCNWGNCLSSLYTIERNKSLLIKAIEKFEQAIVINPYNEMALQNLGNKLCTLGTLTKNPSLFEKSFIQYKKALQISNNANVYNNFTSSIIDYYKITKKQSILDTALEMALLASETFSYNLACVYALLGNKQNALINLEKGLNNNEISFDHVLKDEEWFNYKNDPEFISIINKFK